MGTLLAKIRENFRSPADVREFLRVGRRLRAAHRLKGRLSVPELLAHFTPPVSGPPQEAHLPALDRYVFWWLGSGPGRTTPNCWTRSLALFELLRRHGFGDVGLVVGLNKNGDELAGHAWLVRDDQPFMEPCLDEIRGMKPLFEHPSQEAHDL